MFSILPAYYFRDHHSWEFLVVLKTCACRYSSHCLSPPHAVITKTPSAWRKVHLHGWARAKSSCLNSSAPGAPLLQVLCGVALQLEPPEQRMVKPSGTVSLWRRGLKETQQLRTRCCISLFHQPPFFLFHFYKIPARPSFCICFFNLFHCMVSPTFSRFLLNPNLPLGFAYH